MADPVNKWDQPESAPPPMFFGKKERDLVKQVNDELAERVIGQTVAYYSVSIEDSEYHPIYGEAIDKVTLAPVRVYAYVTVENEQTNERYGYEYQTKLTVNFHRKRLTEDQNLFVRVGDFVQYGDQFYEIVKTYNDTRYYFGQVEHKFQISAECIKARQGTFRIQGEMKPQIVSNAPGAPVVQPLPAPPPAVPKAPGDAQYVVLALDAGLANERVLTAGDNITLTDGGAGGAITIAATATAGGIFTEVDSSNAYTTSSVTIGSAATPTHTLTVPGGMSGSGAFITVGAAILGSTLSVTGAMTLVGTGSLSSINMTGTLSASSTARFDSSISSSGDLAVTGNVHATTFYGSAAGLTGISSDAVDVTSSTGDINYAVVFTEDFQTDGTLGLGGNTGLVYNPSDAILSSSAGAQIVGNSTYGGTLGVSGNTVLGATASVGTTTPLGQLHVSGAHKETMFRVDGAPSGVGNTGTWLLLTGSRGSDGNPVASLGIGTDDPQQALDVNGYVTIGRTGGAYILINDDPDTWIRFGHAGADSMQFQAGGLNFLEFDENGLDIARLNPAGVDIDFQVLTLGNDYTIFAEGSTDRVGIGTQTPSHTLTLAGGFSGSGVLQAVGAVTLTNTLNVSGSSTFAGGITYPRTAVTAATYTVLVTDYYIGVDSTSNAITLTLPAAATAGPGKTYVVKDEGGQAAANNITIDGDGAETVDGTATFDLNSPYAAVTVYTDGSNWFIY